MRELQKKSASKKVAILIVILIFLFSLFKVGQSLASTDSFIITDAAISSKSDTAEVNNLNYEDYSLKSNIVFHKIGDSVTYRINIKNNEDVNYTIVSVSDNNENEYISYEYDNYEGVKFNSKDELSFYITEKYVKEITDIANRDQTFSTNIYITLVDENGEESQAEIPINKPSGPKTGDNLGIYATMATVSLLTLIVLVKMKKGQNCGKHMKLYSMLLIGILVIPTVSEAVTFKKIDITIDNIVSLQDKIIFTYKVGDVVNEKILNYNDLVDELEEPEKNGYNFIGWQKENGDLLDLNTPITEDTSVEAKYEIINYNISYNLDGGSIESGNPTTYTVEDEITLINPTKSGVKFTGWTGSNGNTPQTSVKINKGSTGDKTYKANWKEPETYEIKFDSNGGNDIPSKYVAEGTAIGKLQIPEKENYKFRGWYTDNSYTTKVNENTVPTESTTYYAKWVDWLETVFSIESPVTFNGKDVAIADGEVPDQYLGSDGKFVNSHVALFSEENYDKDFEIGFTIESFDPDDQDLIEKRQYAFVNTKDEDGSTNIRPGFVFRVLSSDKNKLELAAATNTTKNTTFNDYRTVNYVKIYRQKKKIYYSINGGEKKLINLDFQNYTGRFSTETTFGASVQQDGTPFRHLRGTLSNMYVKLEVDDYQE
ncbi:MAG: InlB B-repeat-containing protein [Clostridia bacterium]|nr:InlB B-repeat-containing protein [Clostridia bacterium]